MTQPIHLPNVTLIGVDCWDFPRLELAARICTRGMTFGDVKLLTSLPYEKSRFPVYPIKHIGSTEAYSHFMLAHLHAYVDTEFALVFQHDGFVLNPSAWSDEFLCFDYIGAPWSMAFNALDDWDHPTGGPYRLQNGGFSLRSRRLIQACAELYAASAIPRPHPEDMSICIDIAAALEERGIRFAPLDVAARFSLEAFNSGSMKWNGQFGFHSFKLTDISRWKCGHPQFELPPCVKVSRPPASSIITNPKAFLRQLYDYLL